MPNANLKQHDKKAARRAQLSPYSKRLTPLEVVQHWFRRGRDFVGEIHRFYPDFPAPAPDGLYLLAQIEEFFDRFHGVSTSPERALANEYAIAMEAAIGRG